MDKTVITDALIRLRDYIERENYSGFDPYDALNSPLFTYPFFKSNKLIRFGIQQFVKRSPVNLRPLLKVRKGVNPVTLGLCIQGYTAIGIAGLQTLSEVEVRCESLILQLEKMIPAKYHGACWGYDFDWEARKASIPAYQPTIVATGIITNALYKYYKFSGSQKAFALCKSACEFLLNDLNQSKIHDGICFSYSPNDHSKVFNASMKGVRLLSQVYHETGELRYKESATNGMKYVIANQQNDGSWFYDHSGKGKWVDNYHTGYILDCMNDYQLLTGDNQYIEYIRKGFKYYSENLFEDNFIPKFFNTSRYPLDCTAAAQSILTLCRFDHPQRAAQTAHYTIQQMQSPEGNFYFRKYKNFTEKHAFMRWSDAWMFAALATVLQKFQEK